MHNGGGKLIASFYYSVNFGQRYYYGKVSEDDFRKTLKKNSRNCNTNEKVLGEYLIHSHNTVIFIKAKNLH